MKIRPLKIFKHTLQEVWLNRLAWGRILFAPWLILFAGFVGVALISLVTGESMTSYDGNGEPTNGALLQTSIFLIASTVATVQMTINGYRYVLLGEGGVSWWTLSFNRRLVKMVFYILMYCLLLGLFIGLPVETIVYLVSVLDTGAPLYYIPLFGGGCLLLTVPLGYLLMRLAPFVYLVIALDQPRPFGTSWKLSKGNVWCLLGLFILVALPVYGIGVGLDVLIRFLFSDSFDFVTNILVPPLYAAMITQSFSSVYRDLTGEKPR